WYKWESRRQHARLRLVDVARRQQFGSFRADVSNFKHVPLAKLSFDVEIPMLHVARAQIALNRKRGVRQREREERRKRVVHRQRQTQQREEDVVVKKRRVEVKRFRRCEWRLIVINSVSTSQHSTFANGPRKPNARREVVLVSFEATAR